MTSAVFACVAENREDFATMAHSLLLSIRAFGGELADAPVVINFVDGVEERFAAPIRAAGGEVRVVERVPGSNPLANKLRMLELAEDRDFDVLIALDCDVVVVGDPTPWVDADKIGAKAADFDRFTDAEWRALFDVAGVSEPAKVLTATATGEKTYPYFNSGVLLVPRGMCTPLREAWSTTYRELSDQLAARPEMLREQWRWLAEQVSLSLGILRAGLPWRALPAELNYPSHVPVPKGALAGPPIVVHYHGDRDEHGFLLASSNDEVNPTLDRFNRRRAEVTGVPYQGLRRRPLAERVRQQTTAAMWALLSDRKWYRSEPVARARKQIKTAIRSVRRASA